MKNHQNFFEKALEIQAKRQEKLSEAEKKEIALQLGFSEEDWQAVLDSFQSHFERGTEFLKRSNYEKAITELEDALIIQPEYAETLAALAQACLGEFQTKKRKALKEKALQYAHECLLYSTKNQAAHQVIDAFNPNQDLPKSSLSVFNTQTKAHRLSKKQHTNTTYNWFDKLMMGIITVLPYAFLVAFLGMIMTMGIIYLKKEQQQARNHTQTRQSKSTTQNQNSNQNQQLSYRVKYENPLPFEVGKIPENLAQKYQITQKDSMTWQVSTKSKTPLMELRLIENKWWYPDYSKKEEKTRYYLDLTLEVKTLCDSIRFDGLFFAFQVFDPIQKAQVLFQEDSVYIAQKSNYDRFMYFPKEYFFRKGESNDLYFRYVTKDIERQAIGKDNTLRPSNIVLNLQALKTAKPPVYKEKAVSIINANKDIGIYELKSAFLEDAGSPYSIHFWALKIRNNHSERAVKTLGIIIRYYDKNKQLITEGGDYLIHNLTEPLAAGSENVYKMRTHLGENTYKNPPVVVLPKDIAYKEVEFYALEWE